ncbi:hypothetical protein HanIR_Chr06g0282161 [Helianthus annuus]|nr:hypothetical protein HanIR_Chr06g0282161 [Helianthus annuus]
MEHALKFQELFMFVLRSRFMLAVARRPIGSKDPRQKPAAISKVEFVDTRCVYSLVVS